MNNLNLKNIAEKLIDTFLEAGKVAKDVSHRGVKITIKADKTPVTDGDLIVDQLLRRKIKASKLFQNTVFIVKNMTKVIFNPCS